MTPLSPRPPFNPAARGYQPVYRDAATPYPGCGRSSWLMGWGDVRGGCVALRQQKTGKELLVPFHRDLAAMIAKAPRLGLTILARADGRPLKPATLRDQLQRWAERHGVKVVPHGLRKNAVNALLEAGCSVAETAAISGQSLQVVEHYAKQRNQTALASAAILRWQGNGAGK